MGIYGLDINPKSLNYALKDDWKLDNRIMPDNWSKKKN